MAHKKGNPQIAFEEEETEDPLRGRFALFKFHTYPEYQRHTNQRRQEIRP